MYTALHCILMGKVYLQSFCYMVLLDGSICYGCSLDTENLRFNPTLSPPSSRRHAQALTAARVQLHSPALHRLCTKMCCCSHSLLCWANGFFSIVQWSCTSWDIMYWYCIQWMSHICWATWSYWYSYLLCVGWWVYASFPNSRWMYSCVISTPYGASCTTRYGLSWICSWYHSFIMDVALH